MPKKTTKVVIVSACLVISICCGGPLLYWFQPWPPMTFDAQKWQRDTTDPRPPSNARYRMRSSLLRQLNGPQKGFNRKQIEDELGPSEMVFPGQNGAREPYATSGELLGEEETMIGYALMNEPPFPGSYSEWLWIKFDATGKLDHAWVHNGLI